MTSKIHILLVEDSPSDADLLQHSLHSAGLGEFEFVWVECLGDAIERASKQAFDVVLLDLSLPDSSGPDTFRRLQKAAPGLPVVVLTGLSDESLGLTAVHEGVQDYLVKTQTDGRQTARAIRYAVERKRAEEELRRHQEALLRAKEEWERTFDSVPDLIIILDNQHRIVRANRAVAERLGQHPEQFLGRNCFACVHGTSCPPAACPHALTMEDGREHTIELHEDSLRGDFLISTTPLRDEHGRMIGSVHVARDITERKQAEAALRESREDLNRAQAVAHTGSWRLNAATNELLWSEETYRIFGIPKGTPLTYETFMSCVHPLDRGLVDRSWKAAGQGEPYDIEHRIVVGDRVKWVRERANPDFDSGGLMLGALGTVQDITERKRIEERIRHQNAVLEGVNRILREALACDSEEELGRVCLTVAEHVTGSEFGFIAEVDTERRLRTIAMRNPGWEACRIPLADRKVPSFEVRGLYGRAVLHGEGFFTNDPSSEPDSIGVPEGHPPLTSFMGIPLKHEGKVIGVLALANREGGYMLNDLADMQALTLSVVQVLMRKRAERALRANEERLRQAQKMESIAVLAGGVAHDFNNLLVGVLGSASLAAEMVPADSRIKELLDTIVKAGERAADLTRQMLAYSGKGRFIVQPVDLSEVVGEVTGLVRSTTPRSIEIRSNLESGLPVIEADRSQIYQVLMNLILNAAEAIGDGPGLIRIRTGTVWFDKPLIQAFDGTEIPPGNYVLLEVQDSGCGMDEATRAKIFDPFFTTKFQGRGLGLAAAAGIVRGHNGGIQVRTTPGEGTCFSVLFPAMEPRPAFHNDEKSQQLPAASGEV